MCKNILGEVNCYEHIKLDFVSIKKRIEGDEEIAKELQDRNKSE